jgi:hypothetical protein
MPSQKLVGLGEFESPADFSNLLDLEARKWLHEPIAIEELQKRQECRSAMNLTQMQ